MAEKPIFQKIIERPNPDTDTVLLDGTLAEIEYTGEWKEVEGAKGVKFKPWILKKGDKGADGADIIIEAGGYTPIQLVKAANVVVDIPESGEVDCVVMDLDGDIHVHHFEDGTVDQMVWTQGMIITWVARTAVRLTEFECPIFNDDMFATIPDEATEFEGRSLSEYIAKVKELRARSS